VCQCRQAETPTSETEGTVIHLHGPDQAIAVCDRIERGLHEAAGRAQRACQEAAQELKHMLNLINADRATRGVSPLNAEITVPGDVAGRGDL
jgi:hypothetical protein